MRVNKVQAVQKKCNDNLLKRNSNQEYQCKKCTEKEDQLSQLQKENKELQCNLNQAEDFASEFLMHSIGSIEWEQLRRLAKDIIKRSECK